jgi:hypothetical protein
MAAPVITDYFGTQAEVVTSLADVDATISPTNPCLVIPLAGLASTKFDDVASTAYPDSWMFALLSRVYAFTKADAEEKSFIEVADPTLNLGTRDGQVMEVQDFRLSVFKKRSQVLVFDPDHVNPGYVPPA